MLSRLTIVLFSLTFFLSALELFAFSESFEKNIHVEANVTISLTDLAFEQSDHSDLWSAIIPFSMLTTELKYLGCFFEKEVFQFRFCNRSRASTYLTLKALRV